MGTLSTTDAQLYESFVSARILEGIESHRLEINNGIILVTCGDGDQIPDIFTHLGRVLSECGSTQRIHMVSLNGGPLLLHPASPLATLGESRVLVEHILEASRLKEIDRVVLLAHGPCGKAYANGLGLDKVIDLLKWGRHHLGLRGPHLRISTFVQADPLTGKKETRFVSATRWKRWCEQTNFVSQITNDAPLYT